MLRHALTKASRFGALLALVAVSPLAVAQLAPRDVPRPGELERITGRPARLTDTPRPEEMARLIRGAGSSAVVTRPEEMARITGRPAASREHPRPEEMHRLVDYANEAELKSHRHYRANDGHEVHAPARSTHDQVPAGASAKCRDGTYSFSQHRRGTCSHHGGVTNWL